MNLDDISARFTSLAHRRPFKIAEEPPPSPPKPEEVEAANLEHWAQEKDTRVTYIARLDRLIAEQEAIQHAAIGQEAVVYVCMGDLRRLRSERAWIMKLAGLANR